MADGVGNFGLLRRIVQSNKKYTSHRRTVVTPKNHALLARAPTGMRATEPHTQLEPPDATKTRKKKRAWG